MLRPWPTCTPPLNPHTTSRYDEDDQCEGTTCSNGYYSSQDEVTEQYSCTKCACSHAGTNKGNDGVYNCKQKGEGDYQCDCKAGYNNDNRGDCVARKNVSTATEVTVSVLGSLLFIAIVIGALVWTRRRRKKQARSRNLNNMRNKLKARFPDLDEGFVDYLFESGSICDWLVPFEELDMGQVIGAGASAVVYKGNYAEHVVAIKKLHHLPGEWSARVCVYGICGGVCGCGCGCG